MTVKELIEKLSKFESSAQVATEYHVGDRVRSVRAEPVRDVYDENAIVDAFNRTLTLPQDEAQTEAHASEAHCYVVVIK